MSRLHEESIRLPSGRFALLRARSGPRLLVLLHGFPDHPPNFAALIEALAAGGYDVVAPWLRGYAPSTLDGPHHVERVAEDVLELASALGHERFVLVGHDWGALSTYAACSIAPERVAAAVALSVPHPRMFTRAPQLVRSGYMPLLAAPFGAELSATLDFAAIDGLWRLWSPSLRLDPTRRRALHDCLRASWPMPARYYRALFWPPLGMLSRLSRLRVRVPTLYLHGAQDGCVGRATCRGQERLFRGPFASELRPNAGHFLALEAPEWVAERSLAWFREHAALYGEPRGRRAV